jgi:hypothetical protein
MQNQNNNPIGPDPKETSTPGTSDKNTGESMPQDGETVVNEQEQNKSVNQEEFIEDAAQNTHEANATDGEGKLPSGNFNTNDEDDDDTEILVIGDDTDETQKKIPTLV